MPLGFLEAAIQHVNQIIERKFAPKDFDPEVQLCELVAIAAKNSGRLYGPDISRSTNLSFAQVCAVLKHCVLSGGAVELSEPITLAINMGSYPESIYCSSWGSLYEAINSGYVQRVLKAGSISITPPPGFVIAEEKV